MNQAEDDKVVEVVQRYTALPTEVLTDESELVKDLGADSLVLYEIFSTLEFIYGEGKIGEGELNGVSTIGDIKRVVSKITRESQ